jgi:class 3 adenylate cyclase
LTVEVTRYFFACGFSWGFTLLIILLLFRRSGGSRNPLDWPMAERCMLLISIFFFLGGAMALMNGLREITQARDIPFFNRNFNRSFALYFNAVGTAWALLMAVGMWLRKRAPESRIFAHAVVQFSAIHSALFCYIFGAVTTPTALVFAMALQAFVLLLFPLGVALPWIGTFILLVTGAMIAVSFDLIPYAPYLSSPPFVDGKIHPVYWVTTLSWATLIFMLMIFLITFIVVRWRDRESRVAEMTALLKKMFGRYLSTEVMKTLIDNPSALELGGERRKVTIMMTDLRGFTALSERLEPEQVVQMLNAYFEVMVDIILKYGGTINEIIGDALLVIFGAPQEMPDRAQRGIACSLAMQNAMADVNRQNRERGLPELEMGIGLNEAEVIVGNIGSTKRSKYAVVGSGVNMTSRIESYTVGGQVLISESVRREVGNLLRIDGQREVLPKGAESTITIYEVGGIAGSFNVALEGSEPDMVNLSRSVRLLCTVVEAKHVGKKNLDGIISRLSKKGAEIILKEPVEPLSNLKMNLEDVEEELSSKNFYGKVIHRSGDKGMIHMVRFTAVPPEIGSYFQAFRQHST